MSLFAGPEQHAANPPATWQAVKSGRAWAVATADGKILEHSHRTKRDALEAVSSGWAARQWDKEARWYAGETPAGQRSYAECQADDRRREARKLEAERKRAAEEAARLERERPLRDALEGVREAVGLLSGELEGTRQGLEALGVGHVLTSGDLADLAEWADDDARALESVRQALEEVDAGEVIAEARGPVLEAVERLAGAIRLGFHDAPRDLAEVARMLEDIARDYA